MSMEKSKLHLTIRALLFSYVITGILLVVLSLLLYRFHLQEGQIQTGVHVIYILSCILGGLVIGKSIRKQKFLWGMIVGFFYFAVLLAVSLLLNKGLTGSFQELLSTAILCTASGTVGGMIS